MPKTKYRSSHRSVFNLTVHMIFVTKYRRKVINEQMLLELETVFKSVLKAWHCQLIEFNGKPDHVHLLVSFSPQKKLSDLGGNLKATASKIMKITLRTPPRALRRRSPLRTRLPSIKTILTDH